MMEIVAYQDPLTFLVALDDDWGLLVDLEKSEDLVSDPVSLMGALESMSWKADLDPAVEKLVLDSFAGPLKEKAALIEKVNPHHNLSGHFTRPHKAVPTRMYREFLKTLADKYGNAGVSDILKYYDAIGKPSTLMQDRTVVHPSEGLMTLDQLFKAEYNSDLYYLLYPACIAPLINLQNYLKERMPSPALTWEDPLDFHVTMLYVYNADPQLAAELAMALSDRKAGMAPPERVDYQPQNYLDPESKYADVAQKELPNTDPPAKPLIVADGIGVFENEGNNALHLRVRHTPELDNLQRSLWEVARAMLADISSFTNPPDWNPHITMAYSSEPIDPTTIPDIGGVAVQGGRLTASVNYTELNTVSS